MELVKFLIDEYIVIITSVSMMFLLIVQPQDKRKDDFFLIMIYATILVTAVVIEAEKPLYGSVEAHGIRYVFSIAAYVTRPLILMLLIILIDNSVVKKFMFWIPYIVHFICYISAPFTHLPFYFDEGDWRPGPLEYMLVVVSVIYLSILVNKMYKTFMAVDIKEFLLLLTSMAMTIIAGMLDKLYTESGALYLSTLSVAIIIYYMYVHIQKSKEKDIKRVETINENELELQKKNAELMISQIQPHFIYNTLSSIKYLIEDKPKLAEETLEKFSLYLRGNMSAIGNNEPITFEMEMDQVDNYVFIEKVRFPYIRVEYDITDDIFDVPALTVQPLVENAIKHGIRGKKDGWVRIRTWYDDTDNSHIIEVSDNGVGFDIETADLHVGIENVRKRLDMMVKGTMVIDSKLGEGTVITLRIPNIEENSLF